VAANAGGHRAHGVTIKRFEFPPVYQTVDKAARQKKDYKAWNLKTSTAGWLYQLAMVTQKKASLPQTLGVPRVPISTCLQLLKALELHDRRWAIAASSATTIKRKTRKASRAAPGDKGGVLV
jgi:hypothetical protein